MNNDAPDDNAPFFFDRYPPDTAHWLAGICDEANAKAGDSSYEFRKIMCELISMNLRNGVTHAFRVAEQMIVANAPAAKYLEQQYLKYDQARSAVIETGPDTSDGSAGTTGTPDGTPGQKVPGTDVQDTKGTSDPEPGAGTAGKTGPSVTVTGGCGGGRIAQDDQNTGIGHQGTLFIVHWSDFRASIPARRKKAQTEHRRLYDIQSDVARQIRVQHDELDFLDRAEAADPVLEDLINTHRTETSIAGVLRAAGRAPEDLGLTKDTVTWLDTQLKAV
ncbi:hypothetical protein AQI88_38775 [Streptomyces cellostaticus]|uniref:Uncharacterized protein n=1 Tax=Streptomyces cellostaticus TaxID=67285 RepID=A0A101NBQ3_9ACTN|nr:hypothetical protein [Streptomyces cellostaticus]KUM90251.1 hypothetical protein AQI88_38775 [Streptomyces cellostaticus]GHI10420.1 hypothetical protein Scel_87410 [Streptomyces cellostaticus]